MMTKWLQFITVFVIFDITQHAGAGLSSLQGCMSGKQAESLNEEILKLFEEAPLVDSLTALTSHISDETFSNLEPCFDRGVYIQLVKSALQAIGQDTSGITTYFEQQKLNEIHKFVDSYRQLITPLLGYAVQVENTIKEGNQKRQVLVDSTTSFKDIWQSIRLIQKEHQRTLQSLDIFLKDSILHKSAEIGQYVREGNQNGRWTVSKVKDELLKEFDGVTKMRGIISGAASPLNTMMYEMTQNYAISQVYSALHKSKLENAMLNRWQSVKFSEVIVSQSVRKASKLMYDSMVIGEKKAQQYTTQVNETVMSVRQGMKRIESTSYSTANDCKATLATIRISATFLLVSGSIQLTTGPLMTASLYRAEIETFSTANILPTFNEISIKVALKPILLTVPSNQVTSSALSDAVQFLTSFADDSNTVDIVETNKTLAQVSMYMEQLLEMFRCQRKSIQLIGRIIQGCRDGQDDFEGLYNRHNSALDDDLTKCSQTWSIDVPSKATIRGQVSHASTPEMFDFNFPNCRQNRQQDYPGYLYYSDDVFNDDDDDGSIKKLSPSQRMMVCDLRKRSKSQSSIAQLIKMDENMIGAVRCKQS